jgi:Ribbon-helix-helix domain
MDKKTKAKTEPKAETKIKTALFLERRQIEELKAIQVEVGVPISESVRRAINKYLEERKTAKK